MSTQTVRNIINVSKHIMECSDKYIKDDLLNIENGILKPTKKGKFLTDGIASDLFYLKNEKV